MSDVREKIFTDDGLLVIQSTQDVQAIVEENHRIAMDGAKWVGDARWRKVGSIPEVFADQWARECGAGPGTPEFMEYAKKKLLSGEYSKFVAKGF
jgi:hypothetical protein